MDNVMHMEAMTSKYLSAAQGRLRLSLVSLGALFLIFKLVAHAGYATLVLTLGFIRCTGGLHLSRDSKLGSVIDLFASWLACIKRSSLGTNLIIDPLLEEERCQDGSLMFTYMPSRSEVTQLAITGEWTTPKIHEGMELCLDACKKLAEIMRSCLKEDDSPSNE
ncbi:Exosome complex component RRP41-like [Bienertia sinuspersici]